MENVRYHVLLDGRRLGPYDRRTIVGLRIRHTLSSAHRLETADGAQLTVGELVRQPRPASAFQPHRSGSYSVVQATTSAWVAAADRKLGLPGFRGEVEVRVQTDVLRIAGNFRQAWRWKAGRWKVPVQQVVQWRLRGSLVDLGIRSAPDQPVRSFTLELFTPEAAADFAQNLPPGRRWPADAPAPRGGPATASLLVWAAVAGSLLVVGGTLLWALLPR